MADAQVNQRLDRIDKKLDEVGEAIVLLARIDERLLAQAEQSQRLGERQEKVESRIDRLEHSRSKLLGAAGLLIFVGSVTGQNIGKLIEALL
jgi:vacuolar-type H+-ATPase subunit I/STV1